MNAETGRAGCRPAGNRSPASGRTLGLVLASVLLLAACEPPGRGDTVLFASGADLQSINPLFTVHPLARQTQRYVLLTTLVRYDSAYHVTPYLARRWQWSPDHRRVRLSLATSLRWHDGVPTTARDVVWTLDRARDPGTGYPRLPDLAGVSRVSAPDDSTVVIDFAVPRNDLPDVLTDLAILPAHLLDTVPAGGLRSAAWNQDPVGNGPFRFMAHEPNRRWVFEANPRFPAELGGPPGINRLVIAVVDEPTTKLAALASGELDFAGINPAHAGFVRRDPRLEVLSYPLLFTYGIVFNTREPPFNDRDLRAAISLALDRREIVEGYLYGFGTAASGPVVPGSPGAVDLPVTESLDSARRLLGGRTVRFELLTVGSGEAALEQMIQAQLKRVGIEVVIRQLELGAYLDRVNPRAHDFQAAVMGIPGDLDLGQIPRLAALTGFTVPADPVLAQRRFADSVPVAFIYHARGVQGKNRRVHGVRMDIRGEFPTVSGWTVAAEANAPRN